MQHAAVHDGLQALEVAFSNGATFRYPAELLRAESPSAQGQGRVRSHLKVVEHQSFLLSGLIVVVGRTRSFLGGGT